MSDLANALPETVPLQNGTEARRFPHYFDSTGDLVDCSCCQRSTTLGQTLMMDDPVTGDRVHVCSERCAGTTARRSRICPGCGASFTRTKTGGRRRTYCTEGACSALAEGNRGLRAAGRPTYPELVALVASYEAERAAGPVDADRDSLIADLVIARNKTDEARRERDAAIADRNEARKAKKDAETEATRLRRERDHMATELEEAKAAARRSTDGAHTEAGRLRGRLDEALATVAERDAEVAELKAAGRAVLDERNALLRQVEGLTATVSPVPATQEPA